MGLFSFSKKETKVQWQPLTDVAQLETIRAESNELPIVILKHSIRCSISSMAKNRLDSDWDGLPSEATFYYLDLINYRAISNQIEVDFGVQHQSPQLLVIKDGKCTYSASHSQIDPRTLRQVL